MSQGRAEPLVEPRFEHAAAPQLVHVRARDDRLRGPDDRILLLRVEGRALAGKRGGGFLGTSAYAAAKAGVLGFTKAVAREVAPHGVRSNAVAPGPLEGGMTAGISPAARERLLAHVPLARLGRPEEVAAAVAFLAGDAAAWITGETINVDGGILME